MEGTKVSWISPQRWSSGNTQLLAGSSFGVLREPQHPEFEAGVRRGTGLRSPQLYRQQVAELAKLYREGKTEQINDPDTSQSASEPSTGKIFQNVDGINFFYTKAAAAGPARTRTIFAGSSQDIHHPNVAGATVLSLGCQHAQADILRKQTNRRNPSFDKPLASWSSKKAAPSLPCSPRPFVKLFKDWLRQTNSPRARRSFSFVRRTEMRRLGRLLRSVGEPCDRTHFGSFGSSGRAHDSGGVS